MSTKTAVMTTAEIASRLVELCSMGDFETAQKELFSDDAVSIEPHATPAFEKETKGLDAILEKGHKWNSMVEESHGMKVSQPLVGEGSFAVTMSLDVTMKERGRMDIKIVSEQFFM